MKKLDSAHRDNAHLPLGLNNKYGSLPVDVDPLFYSEITVYQSNLYVHVSVIDICTI